MSGMGWLLIPVVTAVLVLVVKRNQPEQAMVIGLIGGVVLLIAVLSKATPLWNSVGQWMNQIGLPKEYGERLFKALGVALLTQLSADACRDAGESGLASKAEFAGKIALLIIALPLFETVAQTSATLIGGG